MSRTCSCMPVCAAMSRRICARAACGTLGFSNDGAQLAADSQVAAKSFRSLAMRSIAAASRSERDQRARVALAEDADAHGGLHAGRGCAPRPARPVLVAADALVEALGDALLVGCR